MLNHISYSKKPIASINSLAALLQLPPDMLSRLSRNRDSLYRENPPEIKSNGKKRITYSLDRELKLVQKKINRNIFNHVKYPAYLQGSIRDRDCPRTYDKNAYLHVDSRLVIAEDVADFFPSIKADLVFKMWKKIFHFTPEIAKLLTQLTTFKGMVPQGSCTSSYIGNLIFWDVEPKVYLKIRSLGFIYSRYIDDITISSKEMAISKLKIEEIIKLVYFMLSELELKPNRSKHKMMTRSVPIKVHNLNLNSGRPTLGKLKKNRIREEIFSLKKRAEKNSVSTLQYELKYESVTGKVRELAKFHPKLGENHSKSLADLAPKKQQM